MSRGDAENAAAGGKRRLTAADQQVCAERQRVVDEEAHRHAPHGSATFEPLGRLDAYRIVKAWLDHDLGPEVCDHRHQGRTLHDLPENRGQHFVT